MAGAKPRYIRRRQLLYWGGRAWEGTKYLVIHSGSRNLGKQVAEIYQQLAIDLNKGKETYFQQREEIIQTYKAAGRRNEIRRHWRKYHERNGRQWYRRTYAIFGFATPQAIYNWQPDECQCLIIEDWWNKPYQYRPKLTYKRHLITYCRNFSKKKL